MECREVLDSGFDCISAEGQEKNRLSDRTVFVTHPLKDPVMFKDPLINPKLGAERDLKLAFVIVNEPFTVFRTGMDNSEGLLSVIFPAVAVRTGKFMLTALELFKNSILPPATYETASSVL